MFALKIFENKCQIWNQHVCNKGTDKILLRTASLYFFHSKYPTLGILDQKVRKQMSDLKLAPSKYSTYEIWLRLET